jgi:hypothetical protein
MLLNIYAKMIYLCIAASPPLSASTIHAKEKLLFFKKYKDCNICTAWDRSSRDSLDLGENTVMDKEDDIFIFVFSFRQLDCSVLLLPLTT